MAGGQDKFAMDRAEYNRMRKEIERLQREVDALMPAAAEPVPMGGWQAQQEEIERLLDKIADLSCQVSNGEAEIERLRADVKLLSVAAQRADNIEKHRDELRAALEQIVAIDDNYHSSLAIHKALEIAREALNKLREVP